MNNHTDRLPVEILELIFLWTYYDVPDNVINVMPYCMPLSHVCRRWRAVALRCQTLWSDVVRPSLAETQLCLARCHTHSIKIAVDERYTEDDSDSEEYRHAVQLAFSAVQRANFISLKLNAYDGPLLDIVDALTFGGHFLEIQALLDDAETLPAREIRVQYESGPGDMFPVDKIVNNSASTLKVGILVGCELPHPKITSTNIRELRLYNSLLWNNVDEMARFFRAVPLLETLEYSYDHDRHAEMTYPPEYSAPLPDVVMENLVCLDLRSFWREDITIYSLLRTPSHARTSIASRATHETVLIPLPEELEDYMDAHRLRFGDCVLMLMDAFRARHHNPSCSHETLLSAALHSDNLGISCRVATPEDVLPNHMFSPSEAIAPDSQHLRLDVALPVDIKEAGNATRRFSILVRAVACVPNIPLILHFDGNLSTLDTSLLSELAKSTVALVLGQLCDVRGFIALLADSAAPAFYHLAYMEVRADLSDPASTLQELADALEDARERAEEPPLLDVKMYHRRASGELLMLHTEEDDTELEDL